jgi:SAM-dependent methyltransferase/uncharacterized protein YbaR (Trm112 family)
MHRSSMTIIRCPACTGELTLNVTAGNELEVSEGRLDCGCGQSFPISGGAGDLVFPRGQGYGEENAETYDRDIAFIARLLNEDENAVRGKAADLLEIGRGSRVLEVACGPGPNVPHLLERVGADGVVHAFDISPSMVGAARKKLGERPNVEMLLANGVHLPYADRSFDALLHIGTLNRFTDVGRALSEMARVVKVGGKVVAADEGLAPWLEGSDYGSVLKRFGALFKGSPPLESIPVTARDVAVRWLMGHAYFAIDFRVGAHPPQLDLDVPLPGRTFTVRNVLDAQARKPGG